MERTLALVDSARLKPRNWLLAALRHEVLSSSQGHLKSVSPRRNRVLCEADGALRRVYFVAAGASSLVDKCAIKRRSQCTEFYGGR